MEYQFRDFVFNSESLTLLKNGETIKLRINEAKILALLIQDPNKIVSKTEITEQVWPNEVISEQPIFQNISRLRAIFGSKAIINHSKKGYQWQIPLIPNSDLIAITIPPLGVPSNLVTISPVSGTIPLKSLACCKEF